MSSSTVTAPHLAGDMDAYARILAAVCAGHRTVAFVAHHARLSYLTTRDTIAAMITEGYFRVVAADGDLHIAVAVPGQPLVDAGLVEAILDAVRAGARTAADVAARTGLPPGSALHLATAVALRTARAGRT